MDVKRISWIVIACMGGVAVGFGLRRSLDDAKTHEATGPPSSAAITVAPGSDDTLEELLQAKGADLEEKLPLWLSGASSGEIAKLWAAWCERGLPDAWHANLLFAHWFEVDPKAATAAAGVDGRPSVAWVRAMRDPESMLAAIGQLPLRDATAAASALCDFDPEVALKAFASRPGLATPAAVRRLAVHHANHGDPKAALNLMRRYQAGDLPVVMRRWTRDDPEAALAWLKAQPHDGPRDLSLEHFTRLLAATDIARLGDLAARQPHGRIRREMERAVFHMTVETQPEEAHSMARRHESPRIAAEWFAEIGRRQIADDSERAFETLGEMLAACPDAMWIHDRVAETNGFGTVTFEVPGVKDFATSLLNVDPGRALDVALATHAKVPGIFRNPWNGALGRLADMWSERDLEGFRQWLEKHREGPVLDGGAGLLAWTYAHRGNFPEALRWALSIGDEQELAGRIDEVAERWAKQDPEALRQWLESAKLPDPLRSRIHRSLEKNER